MISDFLLAFEIEAIDERRQDQQQPTKALHRRLANIKKRLEPRAVDTIITDLYASLAIRNELCRVDRITKAYDGAPLFQQLAFTIQRRERLAIVGPNGIGKSTLLKVLCGDEVADTGTIAWLQGAGDNQRPAMWTITRRWRHLTPLIP